MDQKAKALDLKYQSIAEKEREIRLHQDAAEMLKKLGLSVDVTDHIARHIEMAAKLQNEVDFLRKEQLEDFMGVKSIEALRVVSMRYLECLSWDEIAELTGKSSRYLMKQRDIALVDIISAKEDSKSSPPFTSIHMEFT